MLDRSYNCQNCVFQCETISYEEMTHKYIHFGPQECGPDSCQYGIDDTVGPYYRRIWFCFGVVSAAPVLVFVPGTTD